MDENRTNGIYYGIDIGEKATLFSYFRKGLEEPVTLSTVMGSEVYQIPTYLAKKRGVGQWFFGNDAIRQVQLSLYWQLFHGTIWFIKERSARHRN